MRLKLPNSQLNNKQNNRSTLIRLAYLKKILFFTSFILILLVIFYLIWNGILLRLSNQFLDKFYYYSTKMGFSLENIYLEGHENINVTKLIEKSSLKEKQPILQIDLQKLKNNLESLEWVRYAIIDRQYPHTLMIRIIEKNPLAVWKDDNKYYLIDEYGTIITSHNIENFRNIPILIGKNAPQEFVKLLPIITKDRELYNNISLANWIGERRWNIKFLNGVKVKLPEQNVANAWDYVIKLYYENKLSNMQLNYIDLRIMNKVYLK